MVSKDELPHPQTSDKLQGCAYIPLQELASQCKDAPIVRYRYIMRRVIPIM